MSLPDGARLVTHFERGGHKVGMVIEDTVRSDEELRAHLNEVARAADGLNYDGLITEAHFSASTDVVSKRTLGADPASTLVSRGREAELPRELTIAPDESGLPSLHPHVLLFVAGRWVKGQPFAGR